MEHSTPNPAARRGVLKHSEFSPAVHQRDLPTNSVPDEVWSVTEEQESYYKTHFLTLQPDIKGSIDGQSAKEFFRKSKLPIPELSKIWQLSDIDNDGALVLTEFMCAMHLVVARRHNIPLPQTLPRNLRSFYQRRAGRNSEDPGCSGGPDNKQTPSQSEVPFDAPSSAIESRRPYESSPPPPYKASSNESPRGGAHSNEARSSSASCSSSPVSGRTSSDVEEGRSYKSFRPSMMAQSADSSRLANFADFSHFNMTLDESTGQEHLVTRPSEHSHRRSKSLDSAQFVQGVLLQYCNSSNLSSTAADDRKTAAKESMMSTHTSGSKSDQEERNLLPRRQAPSPPTAVPVAAPAPDDDDDDSEAVEGVSSTTDDAPVQPPPQLTPRRLKRHPSASDDARKGRQQLEADISAAKQRNKVLTYANKELHDELMGLIEARITLDVEINELQITPNDA